MGFAMNGMSLKYGILLEYLYYHMSALKVEESLELGMLPMGTIAPRLTLSCFPALQLCTKHNILEENGSLQHRAQKELTPTRHIRTGRDS